jgi:hypothetical protein
MRKKCIKFILTGSVLLGFLGNSSSQASMIDDESPTQTVNKHVNFFVDITTGSLEGKRFSGSFAYDDSTLTGVGSEEIYRGIGDFQFNFDWFGEVFDENSNPGFAAGAEFHDGNLLGVRYFLGWDETKPNFYILRKDFYYEDTTGTLHGLGTVSYVPIPGAIWLFGSAIVGLGLHNFRRQKMRSQDNLLVC